MLDKLKIIPLDKIIAFEAPAEERVARLTEEIEGDGKLRNPLLVKPLDDRFLLLDDVSILTALDRLNLVHVPIQPADATLTARPWQRVVESWHIDDLLAYCRAFPRYVSLSADCGPLSSRQAEIRFRDHAPYRLNFTSESFLTRCEMVGKLIASCGHAGGGFRAKLALDCPDPLLAFPQATAAVYPPFFSLEELAVIAGGHVRLPYGLIRIDQPGRILGIDYSLGILRERAPLEEKESFLKELIRIRMASDRTAYYDGYVLVLNN
jgi:hypothetical protein